MFCIKIFFWSWSQLELSFYRWSWSRHFLPGAGAELRKKISRTKAEENWLGSATLLLDQYASKQPVLLSRYILVEARACVKVHLWLLAPAPP